VVDESQNDEDNAKQEALDNFKKSKEDLKKNTRKTKGSRRTKERIGQTN